MFYQEINQHLLSNRLSVRCGKINNISFAGNGRYFILTEGGEEKKETKPEKTETVDVKSELKKYKEMLDEGLIDKEDYEAKKKELLGLQHI